MSLALKLLFGPPLVAQALAGHMASDGFHPGEPVYRYCAETIARHIATREWPGMRP